MIFVKCSRCGTIFGRYNYGKQRKRVQKPHRRSRFRGHKRGLPNPMMSCNICRGQVEGIEQAKVAGILNKKRNGVEP